MTLSIRWETPNRPRLAGSLVFKFPLYSSLSRVSKNSSFQVHTPTLQLFSNPTLLARTHLPRVLCYLSLAILWPSSSQTIQLFLVQLKIFTTDRFRALSVGREKRMMDCVLRSELKKWPMKKLAGKFLPILFFHF